MDPYCIETANQVQCRKTGLDTACDSTDDTAKKTTSLQSVNSQPSQRRISELLSHTKQETKLADHSRQIFWGFLLLLYFLFYFFLYNNNQSNAATRILKQHSQAEYSEER